MRRGRLTFLVHGASQAFAGHFTQSRSSLRNACCPCFRLGSSGVTSASLPERTPNGSPAAVNAADVYLLAFYPDGAPRVPGVHGKSVINDFSSDSTPTRPSQERCRQEDSRPTSKSFRQSGAMRVSPQPEQNGNPAHLTADSADDLFVGKRAPCFTASHGPARPFPASARESGVRKSLRFDSECFSLKAHR